MLALMVLVTTVRMRVVVVATGATVMMAIAIVF